MYNHKIKASKNQKYNNTAKIEASNTDPVANGSAIAVTTKVPTEAVSKEPAATKAKIPAKRGRRPGSVNTASKKIKEAANSEIYFQFDGQEILSADIETKVKEAYRAEGHRIGAIHSLQIYVNANEGQAYYVINGKPGTTPIALW